MSIKGFSWKKIIFEKIVFWLPGILEVPFHCFHFIFLS